MIRKAFMMFDKKPNRNEWKPRLFCPLCGSVLDIANVQILDSFERRFCRSCKKIYKVTLFLIGEPHIHIEEDTDITGDKDFDDMVRVLSFKPNFK